MVAPNRAGEEDGTRYVGRSLIISPDGGKVIAEAPTDAQDHALYAELDPTEMKEWSESAHFLRDLRPDIYS